MSADQDCNRNLRRTLKRNEDVITRDIAGETILVPIRNKLAHLKQIYVLNDVGAHIWQQLDGTRTLKVIHRSIVENFDVSDQEALEHLFEFVNDLEHQEVVTQA